MSRVQCHTYQSEFWMDQGGQNHDGSLGWGAPEVSYYRTMFTEYTDKLNNGLWIRSHNHDAVHHIHPLNNIWKWNLLWACDQRSPTNKYEHLSKRHIEFPSNVWPTGQATSFQQRILQGGIVLAARISAWKISQKCLWLLSWDSFLWVVASIYNKIDSGTAQIIYLAAQKNLIVRLHAIYLHCSNSFLCKLISYIPYSDS